MQVFGFVLLVIFYQSTMVKHHQTTILGEHAFTCAKHLKQVQVCLREYTSNGRYIEDRGVSLKNCLYNVFG